jgi:hypothetical protein
MREFCAAFYQDSRSRLIQVARARSRQARSCKQSLRLDAAAAQSRTYGHSAILPLEPGSRGSRRQASTMPRRAARETAVKFCPSLNVFLCEHHVRPRRLWSCFHDDAGVSALRGASRPIEGVTMVKRSASACRLIAIRASRSSSYPGGAVDTHVHIFRARLQALPRPRINPPDSTLGDTCTPCSASTGWCSPSRRSTASTIRRSSTPWQSSMPRLRTAHAPWWQLPWTSAMTNLQRLRRAVLAACGSMPTIRAACRSR